MKFDELSDYHINDLEEIDFSYETRDKANAAIRMIQYLPVVYQTVFNLRAIEGYSFREISEKLQINESTLRSHYRRAKIQLKENLEKELENER